MEKFETIDTFIKWMFNVWSLPVAVSIFGEEEGEQVWENYVCSGRDVLWFWGELGYENQQKLISAIKF